MVTLAHKQKALFSINIIHKFSPVCLFTLMNFVYGHSVGKFCACLDNVRRLNLPNHRAMLLYFSRKLKGQLIFKIK